MQQFTILIIFCWSLLFSYNSHAINGISIMANEDLLHQPNTQKTIDDCIRLLQQACNCPVDANNREQEILLQLPTEVIPAADSLSSYIKDNITYLAYPAQDYTWRSVRQGNQIILTLDAQSYEAISFGLYGLLQEQLGFGFYHAKETYIPALNFWNLTEKLEWEVTPRFNKRGFHIHTMHPLEMTEPLLNPDCPNGITLVKEYIDWLARNQQNYLEFNLLETDELERWTAYIKPAMLYAQQRGIMVALDISLHMTQQKAFMLYQSFPNTLQGKKKQIEANLDKLFEVPWNLISMEFSATEFTEGNVKKKQALELYINDLITNKYNSRLYGREHVVKKENTLGKAKEELVLTSDQALLDATRGMFVHTVMFYGLRDEKAPVYENPNLLHMLDILKEEKKTREVWYFPESAYWVTFDNSVPMLLLPYLQTRLDDILLMDTLGIEGHLTFSSGWEWGYWAIDWSIARWSWKSKFNGQEIVPGAITFIGRILQNSEATNLLKQAADLQQEYIKDKELIRYLVAQTITDELPWGLSMEFHPRPPQAYPYMARKASQTTIDEWYTNAINPLKELHEKTVVILEQMKQDFEWTEQQAAIWEELRLGIEITNLRVAHKIQTLQYLLQKRVQKLNKDIPESDAEQYLFAAQEIRKNALEVVRLQEKSYRYPYNWIAEKIEGGGSTSYDFGYLYTVSNLHFWEREEEQIKQNKYGALFRNIWDVARIGGIVD